jgi:hypothetical protein
MARSTFNFRKNIHWVSRRIADLEQANVMLSYPIDEAEELLSSKLSTAKQNTANCEEDLDFLREQITVGTLRRSQG